MIWLLMLVIAVGLSVPYWMGIAPKSIVPERRFIARMTIAGLVAGVVFDVALTFAWRQYDFDFDFNPLLVVANGAALGAVAGLVGAFFIRVSGRSAREQSKEKLS